ncbi:hypothetical protein GCM10027093_11290 [Paraburkholderia jirisanensis]
MDNAQNFLESDGVASLFADRTRKAGKLGGLNAKPLMDALDRAFSVSQGVATVLRMHKLNSIRSDIYADRDGGEVVEPPLSNGGVANLLELARVASELMACEIQHTADWTDEYCASALSNKSVANVSTEGTAAGAARTRSPNCRAGAVAEEALG